MDCARGVSNLIFLLMLISGFIVPIAYAGETTNVTDLTATPGQVNEIFNLSEYTAATTTIILLTPGPTVTEMVPSSESSLQVNTTTTPVPADTLTFTPATPRLIPEPVITPGNSPGDSDTLLANPSESLIVQENQSEGAVNPSGSLEITGTSHTSPPIITKSSGGREYVADQVIVRYNSNRFQNANAMSASAAGSDAKMGARVEKDFSNVGLSGMQVVKLPENLSVDDAIAEYQKNPDVLYAEPNYIYHIDAVTPNDPLYGNEWGPNNIAAPDAWGISTGSSSVIVAVIDTGINYSHPDLSANIWTNPGEIPGNNIDDDHNGYIDDVHGWNFITNSCDPVDDNGHGTHVSGTIGAVGNNSIGVTGVNWNVKIMALKFLGASGSGSTSDAIPAIRYANANGASVISNSWGGPDNSQALKDAIDGSSSVVVCAAGNTAANTDLNPHYPSAYTSVNIISVAASTPTDQLASFSNYGPVSVDLAAPGTSILSTSYNSNYIYMQGTSMATPHVSGVAALVKAVNPGLTNNQIKNVILNNVDVLSSLSGKVNMSGRLNAYKAVLAAQRMAEPNTVGVYRNGRFYLRNSNGGGPSDSTFIFGQAGDVPVIGDWNGNGTDTIGVYRNGRFYLRNTNSGGVSDTAFIFGQAGDVPVIGDWNADGTDTVGVYRNGRFYLRNTNSGGVSDTTFIFGQAGDVPVIGDWNADGTDTVGVYRNGRFYLRNTNSGGVSDTTFIFGQAGDVPVIGDWNADGTDTVGVYRNGRFYLRNTNSGGASDNTFIFGQTGDVPVSGQWT